MLLDSTFLFDLIGRSDAAESKLDELIETETPVSISTLSIYEVRLGLRESEHEIFEEILASMVVLPLGLAESQRALSIQRPLHDQDKPIGDVDSLIAATAVESSDPRVLTRNLGEFERVEGLIVETY